MKNKPKYPSMTNFDFYNLMQYKIWPLNYFRDDSLKMDINSKKQIAK